MKQDIFATFIYFRKMEEYLMAKKEPGKKELKRKARKAIEEKISAALADLKKDLGEKKFTAGLKKAGKIFLVKKKKATADSKAVETRLSAKKLSAVVSDPVK